MNSAQFEVKWSDSGKEPKCLPDLRFPNGVDLDGSHGKPACKVELPYPAPRIGCHQVSCRQCGVCVLITAAGRFDDPKTVMIPCSVKLPATQANETTTKKP